MTSLNGYATPFIRYNSNDIGMIVDDECDCGLQLPLMQIADRRSSDIIVLTDGRKITAHEVCIGIYAANGIKQFQIIQESLNHFQVKVIVRDEFPTEQLTQSVVKAVGEKLGDAEVQVIQVNDIPR